MDEGYILSNKIRKAVFEGLASGETDIGIVAKKHHIILRVAIKIADELTSGGLLEKKGNKYILTKEGKKIASIIKE